MNKNIGDNEARIYDYIGNIYRDLHDLMGAIYDGHPFKKEELLEALGGISNKILNAREEYVISHMNSEERLLDFIDSERHSLNQALSASIEAKSQTR